MKRSDLIQFLRMSRQSWNINSLTKIISSATRKFGAFKIRHVCNSISQLVIPLDNRANFCNNSALKFSYHVFISQLRDILCYNITENYDINILYYSHNK